MSTGNDEDQFSSEEAEDPMDEVHKEFEKVNKTHQIACLYLWLKCRFYFTGCKLILFLYK